MDESRGRIMRSALLLVVAAMVVVAIAAPASAHSALVSSTPAEGASVESPATVTLVFNEALLEVGSDVSVTDANGVVTPLSPAYPEPATLVASLPVLAAGVASVTWRVVSEDGHPVEGVLSFTVASAPAPSPSPEPPASTDASPEPTPTPSPSVSITPISAPASSGGLPAWLWAALVLAVLAAGGVAVATSRKR